MVKKRLLFRYFLSKSRWATKNEHFLITRVKYIITVVSFQLSVYGAKNSSRSKWRNRESQLNNKKSSRRKNINYIKSLLFQTMWTLCTTGNSLEFPLSACNCVIVVNYAKIINSSAHSNLHTVETPLSVKCIFIINWIVVKSGMLHFRNWLAALVSK